MRKEESLRRRLVFAVFFLFVLVVLIFVGAIRFLIKTNMVSMDHVRALGDLRQVGMYLDLRAPGDWEVHSNVLFKGGIPITGNVKILGDITRYMPPGSSIDFHIGILSKEELATMKSLRYSDPFSRFISASLWLDRRFRLLLPEERKSKPWGSEPPMDMEQDDIFSYLTADGILTELFDSRGGIVGWMLIRVGTLERGEMERWVVGVSTVAAGFLSCLILAFLYVTLFRLSSPIVHLEESHSKVVQEKRQLETVSRSDPLTGLLNRRGFDELRRSIAGVDGSSPYGLAILDLDNFKAINDTYGHSCGDFVLIRVAAMIQKSIRRQDVACRWGGEEFLVRYPDATPEIVREAAERLRVSIAAFPVVYEGREIPVTVTIGTSLCRNEDGFDEAFRAADAALYRGKREGKNRVVCGDGPVSPGPEPA